MNRIALRTTVTVVLAASMMALTGCGAGAGPSGTPSSPTGDAPSTPSATPSATEPTEPSADPADITTWTISEQGIGPVRLGESFSDTAAGLPAWKVAAACSWTAFLSADERSVNGFFVRDSDDEDGDVTTVTFEALADSVIPDDGPRTAQGIGLGSSRDEVMTAYPSAAAQEPTIADGEFIRVGAQGEPAIYFAIREGATTVTAVTVTDRDEPPYEVCG